MVTIGFNSTGYSITENDGSVLLTVHVLLEEMFGEGVTVHVRLITLHGTANGMLLSPIHQCWHNNYFLIIATVDYENLTVILNFNESSTTFEVPLTIIDDDVLENDEEFTVLLELMNTEYDDRVTLQPNVSRITILDNDS